MSRNSPIDGRMMPTHGLSKSRVYHIWNAMKMRCENPNSKFYSDYGGRGITVCERWASFENFFEDMGHPPAGTSLERENNDAGYSRANCRWATRMEQARNKRNNVLLTIDGETHPLSVWAERFGIKYGTVHQRLTKYGWTAEDAVKMPLVTKRAGCPRGTPFHLHNKTEENGVVWSDPEARAA